MIKTRIASTAALATFGLAALGGTALTIAAPANARVRGTLYLEETMDLSG